MRLDAGGVDLADPRHRPTPSRPARTGLVLAGGAGRRLGGIDKGLVELAGRPLACWVLDVLLPQVDRCLISANRSQAEYRALGVPVLADRRPGLLGPLAGIDAALAQADTPWLLVAPCDTPRLPRDLGDRLASGLDAAGADIAVAVAAGRRQPLHALLPTALAPDLDCWLGNGGRAVRDYLARHRCAEVHFDDCPDRFANANTPAELARLECLLRDPAP